MYARQQAAVAELSRSALAGTTVPALLSQAVALIAQTLDIEYSALFELEPSRNALRLLTGIGWNESIISQERVDVEVTSFDRYVLLRNTPILVDDWHTESRFSQPSFLRGHGVACSLRVLVPGPKGPFGILGADSTKNAMFTCGDLDFLQAVANVLSMAIARAHTNRIWEHRFEAQTREIERRHHVIETLHKTLAILNSTHSLDQILNYIIAEACHLLGTAAGAIYELDIQQGLLKSRAAYGLDNDNAQVALPVDWGAAGEAVLKRQPVHVNNAHIALSSQSESSPVLPQNVVRLTRCYRSLLAVPLIIEDNV